MAPRKRAPGGGRKPLPRDRAKSAKLMVRLKPDLLHALDGLANQHDRTLSEEIRDALWYWLKRSGRPELHVGSLTSFIEMLVSQIEQKRNKRWMSDPVAAVAVREQVDRLIRHLAPASNKPVTVPPEIDGIVGGLIALAELLRSPEDIPRKHWRVPEAFVDGPQLARIMEDLGSGWERSNPPRRRHK